MVPFKVGRRALAHCAVTDRWFDAVGARVGSTDCWVVATLDDEGDLDEGRWWLKCSEAITYLRPKQCQRCFGLENKHEPGCMVVENLANGVPAFYAPYAMWAWPKIECDNEPNCDLFKLNTTGGYILTLCHADDKGWETECGGGLFGKPSESPLVALGLDGFTLTPWEA